ncbi:MAG: dihydrofolate reductase, partial [Cytophagales bacterium]
MLKKKIFILILLIVSSYSCTTPEVNESKFNFFAEQFEDIKVLRYQVPGFEELTLKQKKLVYFLTEAGLAGRDIMYDQNYRHNLSIRRALENVYSKYDGDKENSNWKSFEIYLKRIWFSNGIHHHYSNDKFVPGFSNEYLQSLLSDTETSLNSDALDIIFDDSDSKKVNRDASKGLVIGSAVNFYGEDVTEKDVDTFYSILKSPDPNKPLSLGLNSKLVKEDGKLMEKIYRVDGMYSNSIKKIIYWL